MRSERIKDIRVLLKVKIRKEIKEKLNKQNDTQRLHKSLLIKKKLFQLTEFKKAKRLLCYIAKPEEVQTQAIIAQAQKIGKQILVPVILKGEKRMIASLVEDLEEELTVGPYRIPRPQDKYIREMPPESIDLAVVPGLAFDTQGRRLGRGGGYFDKFLTQLAPNIPRIGLAFDFQVLKDLPVLPHDISVTKVISA